MKPLAGRALVALSMALLACGSNTRKVDRAECDRYLAQQLARASECPRDPADPLRAPAFAASRSLVPAECGGNGSELYQQPALFDWYTHCLGLPSCAEVEDCLLYVDGAKCASPPGLADYAGAYCEKMVATCGWIPYGVSADDPQSACSTLLQRSLVRCLAIYLDSSYGCIFGASCSQLSSCMPALVPAVTLGH
jgi:hypothetical protein